jgi:hypothetical protein
MSIFDLERRLARIEAGRRVGAPTAILTDRPIGDPTGGLETANAMATWQRWVARDTATVNNGVLSLAGPEMTDEEWAAQFVTEH